MRWLVDFVYLSVAIVTSPIWLARLLHTGKIRTDWPARLGRTPVLPPKTRPRILFHAVSVGEVNAIRNLVDELSGVTGAFAPAAKIGGLEIVIATTTDTGLARAQGLWGDRHVIVRYPFDFSSSVGRFLNGVNPDVVALVELEVWPNFTAECARRGIPVMVVNGRLTARSFRRYRRLGHLIRPMFRRLKCAAVQNQAYAERFHTLGVSRDAIHVTGTMKWDTARIEDSVGGADQLACEMGIDRGSPLIVAGSTAPDEHELLLRATPPEAQLLCAPRKPEWFEQAAEELPGCVRRSRLKTPMAPTDQITRRPRLFLLDTIGELRQAYALADVVIVGRSFGNLHGSDMMEPIALGKPTIVGPAVADFQDTVDALLAGDGIIQTTAARLPDAVRQLLSDPMRQTQLAENGRAVIRAHQGATRKNASLILDVLRNSSAVEH